MRLKPVPYCHLSAAHRSPARSSREYGAWSLLLMIVVGTLLPGCVTGSRPPSRELFPAGTYRQEVEVVTEERSMAFEALIKKQPEKFTMVALNEMGMSLFKLSSINGKPPELLAAAEEIKDRKQDIERLFRLVEKTFSLRETELKKTEDGYQWTTTLPTIITQFGSLDEYGIPRTTKMEMPGRFQVNVKTTGYTLERAMD